MGRAVAMHLGERLPAGPGSLAIAAFGGLQDSAPRAGLLSLHARVDGVTPDAWEDPSLVQVWGPRGAVYLIPADADAVAAFVVGRGDGSRPRNVIRWDTRTTTVLDDVELPDVDPAEARIDLARRFVAWFGDAMRPRFAGWAALPEDDADAALAHVEPTTLPDGPVEGVRLLPLFDPYLYGRPKPAGTDTFFNNALLVDGRIDGVWARRDHRVRIRTRRSDHERIAEAALALELPIGRRISLSFVD